MEIEQAIAQIKTQMRDLGHADILRDLAALARRWGEVAR